MKQSDQSMQLGTEPIPKLLRKLSIPAIIGMLVMSIYNVVDTIFISYAVGIDGVAAVTIAFPIMLIVMAVAAALGIGGASLISRRLGERREAEANRVFNTVISLVVIVSMAGVISSFTILEPVLRMFGATPELMQGAHDYIFPIMLGTVFFSFAFATNAIIRSEGNSKFAMMTMIVPAVLNIILDPIFIIWLDMGVQGAAIATVLAQASISFIVLWYFLSGKSSLLIVVKEMLPRWSITKEVVVIGMPAFVRQVAGSVMMVAINSMLIIHGSEFYVGVFGIVQRVSMFALMPMMGILQGMQPIVGYNFGAKQLERMRETILVGFKVVTVFSIAVFIIMMAFPNVLMRIFTADTAVIETGSIGMRIIFACAFLIGAQLVSGGLYQALGKAKPALILSMARQILFLVPLVLILPHFFGVWGVFIAFPLADILAFALSIFFMYKDRKLFFTGGEEEIAFENKQPASS
jgi:putative MATE family efflux protein